MGVEKEGKAGKPKHAKAKGQGEKGKQKAQECEEPSKGAYEADAGMYAEPQEYGKTVEKEAKAGKPKHAKAKGQDRQGEKGKPKEPKQKAQECESSSSRQMKALTLSEGLKQRSDGSSTPSAARMPLSDGVIILNRKVKFISIKDKS